jgi:hypothetical protein
MAKKAAAKKPAKKSVTKKDFWNPWAKKQKTFTSEQVKDLLERVKMFNAGAIDAYLTKHVDAVFECWAKEHK